MADAARYKKLHPRDFYTKFLDRGIRYPAHYDVISGLKETNDKIVEECGFDKATDARAQLHRPDGREKMDMRKVTISSGNKIIFM